MRRERLAVVSGGVSLRAFEPQEWRAYRDLRLRSLGDAPEAFGSTLAQEENWPDDTWRERLASSADLRWNCPLLAETGPDPVGLAWGRIDSATPERADLYQMWVDPERRRLGAGRLLVDGVITWATDSGARFLALRVACANTPASRLYTRAGFLPVGEPEPLRPEAGSGAQAMRLDLPLEARGSVPPPLA